MMTPDAASAVLSTTTTRWTKSTFSDQQNCVEIGTHVEAPGFVGIRDSKLGDESPVFVLSHASFKAFLSYAVATKSSDLEGR